MDNLRHLTISEKKALDLLISKLKQRLNDQLRKLQLFGSKVRGDYHSESDIDLLLVVRERTENVLDQVAEISLEVDLVYDPHISIVIFSEDEYKQNKAWETPFINSVENERLSL